MANFRRISHGHDRTGEDRQAFNGPACCVTRARELHQHNHAATAA